MSIHGQSIFDVFAKPVVSDDGISVRYDGFATIIQGDKQFTYAVINGAAYVEDSVGNNSTSVATKTVRCLDSITPFNSIVAALNTVKVIPSTPSIVEDEYIDCSSGTLLKTSTPFGGLNFTLCSSADGFIAYGGDITMAVQYLNSPLRDLTTPTLTDKGDVCKVLATATPVTSTAATLLAGNVVSSTAKL